MIGKELGHYRVLEKIGAGGMGEVFKATDNRLDRTVAIKVLPEHMAASPELKQRFEREAKAISQLNHPHICTLHDVGSEDGVDFLVMELLEGETLADRLERGPLPPSEAVAAAIQIAAALDEAHRHGIVHRDLKPGNIVVTETGLKLLDFGLAKLSEKPLGDDSRLQTEAKPLTSEGTIMGTFQYMAPEQLEGKEADARTDIFALGVVLYEMLTGKKAFEGKTQASLIAAILEREPASVSTEQPLSPRGLDRIVSRCLAKDPAHRWESARDIREVLSWLEEDGGEPERAGSRASGPAWIPWGAAALLAVAASGLTYWWTREEPPEPQPLAHFTVELPEESAFNSGTPSRNLTISPNGEYLVYSGNGRLHARRLGHMEVTTLGDPGGARRDPFFSPDGEWVGFWHNGAWKRVSVRGGPTTTLCETDGGSRGASWGPNGLIVFATSNPTSGLLLIPDAGGTPEVLTTPDPNAGELNHRWPEFLPDGKTVLFDVVASSGDADGLPSQIEALSLETRERKLLIPGGSNARYVPTGHIVYAAEGALRAVGFDPERLEVLGNPFPVVADVGQKVLGTANFAVASNGTLVFNPNPLLYTQTVLAWVDREGTTTPLPLPASGYDSPSLSPDGTKLALTMRDESGADIWVYDIERGTLGKRTFGGTNLFPTWTPDGEEILYTSPPDAWSISRLRADGSGSSEKILATGLEEFGGVPTSWSDEHRVLLFQRGANTWKLSIDQESATPFITHENHSATEREARFSPDQNYVAYRSDETGRDEVYVIPYPGPGGKWQVSTDGGAQPMWASDGSELFFKSGDRLMAVSVQTEPSFEAGTPRVLFESEFPESTPGDPARYAVSADAQRFLVTIPAPGADEDRPEIHVILNWFQELERLTPER